MQADDTCGGLFGTGDDTGQQLTAVLVQHIDQIGPIIHGEMGFVIKRSVDVLVIGHIVFTLNGVYLDLIVRNKRRCDLVLGGEWV